MIPPELKKITQYIRRAEELDRDRTYPESRLVAYYLRQYACQIGISSMSSSSAGSIPMKECLSNILNTLEGEKKAMSNFTKKEAQFLCRGFADRVLEKANQQDLAVVESLRSTPTPTLVLDSTMQQVFKDIAQAFYAAGTFYDILQQFYDSSSSIATTATNNENENEERKEENKRRLYCKYKATNILKDLKEGRIPTSTTTSTSLSQEDDGVSQENNTLSPMYVQGTTSVENDLLKESRDSTFTSNIYIPSSTMSASVSTSASPLPTSPDMMDIPSVPYHKPTIVVPSSAATTTLPPVISSTGWTSSMSMDSSIPLIPVPVTLTSDTIVTSETDDSLPIIPRTNRGFESRRSSMETSGVSFTSNKGKQQQQQQVVSKTQISDARELTHFAMAALEAKDVDLAAERLQGALEALGRR